MSKLYGELKKYKPLSKYSSELPTLKPLSSLSSLYGKSKLDLVDDEKRLRRSFSLSPESIKKIEVSDSESEEGEVIDLTLPSDDESEEDCYETESLEGFVDDSEGAVYVCFNDCTFNL